MQRELLQQSLFRAGGLLLLLGAWRVGPSGLRRHLPALIVLAGVLLLLVWAPGIGKPENGAHRWIRLPVLHTSFQPSELARIAIVLWVADRCTRLGPKLRHLRSGLLPVLCTGLCFVALVALEPDLGGALLLLACVMSTLWVGGARSLHFAGSLTLAVTGAVCFAIARHGYIRSRIAVFLGEATNDQVTKGIQALGSGEPLGVGYGRGLFRNAGVPYQDSDYVFALVGEELGLLGVLLLLGLLLAFVLFSLRLVLSIRDRFAALAAFGLLLSVGVQAMLHVQVVCGLAPPKGMTLPFVSDGGTSLLISSLAVGIALGAARESAGPAPPPPA
jgi:cell division protein FtsW